ncbi:hypothetical protein [Clostridium sp.]|uniref:hypothetical protein n=1 Tax=Clostridium sp. TaxID=1506 RepID=UPI00261B3878|nr:hypothetical protein [Clostridium sp.]
MYNIRLEDKNYILETPKEKYLLKVTSSKNVSTGYDIINLENRVNNKIFIINGNVI